MKKLGTFLLLFSLMASIAAFGQSGQPAVQNNVAIAAQYGQFRIPIVSAPSASGAGTITLQTGAAYLPGGKKIYPFSVIAPIRVYDGSNTETVTPTAVSNCSNDQIGVCQITATFANLHGAGPAITVGSGSFGLQEAINDIQPVGGKVVLTSDWGGTSATAIAATPFGSVYLDDQRGSAQQFWNVQTGATTLAAPATLTATTVGFGINGANTTGGTWTGTNTYHYTIACVDIMGQEGPGSADFSAATAGTGATNQIGFSAPAAQTGCVGYVPYISLTGGSYALSYKVPLVTQPTVAGVPPVSNGVCTLTTIETITPACAITNTTYGQTGSAAIVSALTLNTSPIVPAVTTVSSTTVYTPNAGGRTTAVYTPSPRIAAGCLNTSFLPFTISAAEATTVPSVIGTVNVGPGCMNFVGRTLEVCGKATSTASTATIVHIQFQWDAMGQNTAGKGVVLGDLAVTPVAAFSTTKVATFCEQFQTTVAGASATAGSINTVGGSISTSGVSAAAAGQAAGSDATIGTVAALNLAVDARLNVISVHTTGTDGAAFTLQGLSAKFIN